MSVLGAVVTLFYLMWLAKRIYPGYYYEGLLSMYGMMTGTISSGILLLREIDPDMRTPAANNLVLGSSTGILFGIPMLIFINMAAESERMLWVTIGCVFAYWIILLLVIFKAKRRSGKRAGSAQGSSSEEQDR